MNGTRDAPACAGLRGAPRGWRVGLLSLGVRSHDSGEELQSRGTRPECIANMPRGWEGPERLGSGRGTSELMHLQGTGSGRVLCRRAFPIACCSGDGRMTCEA